MQSLIKFLRLKPFDEPEVWDYWIGMKAVKAANMPRLNTIGNALILRRTKEEVKNDGGKVQNIPPKYVTDVKIKMGEDHRNVYQYFKEFAESKFKVFLEEKEDAAKQQAAANYVAGRNKLKNQKQDTEIVSFSTILVLMLRMRQVSVLPFLTSKMLGDDDEDLSGEFDPLDDEDVISHKNPVFAETFISAKLAQLFEDLEEIKNKCLSENRPMDKVIIVSQWTTLLKIVHSHLRYRGYSLATVSGEIKFEDRAETVRRFNSDSKRPQIMLLSLAAGGVGLNLVGGNHMIFLDIHYNPQLELQAQDRIHRFGQTKDVHIRRYICEDSMEERVVALQATKLELSNGLLSSSNKKGAAGVGLSLQDIRKLFDM
jgi:transcription termination factor 2